MVFRLVFQVASLTLPITPEWANRLWGLSKLSPEGHMPDGLTEILG